LHNSRLYLTITIFSPQHSNVDIQCRPYVFQICQSVAQDSDTGCRALIENNVLPVLVQLAADKLASNVISTCELLNALAYTGTFRSELISAGVKTAMERITRYVAKPEMACQRSLSAIPSPISKSTLNDKSDKKVAQTAAKSVLSALEMKQ
jgi:hypothetical protein